MSATGTNRRPNTVNFTERYQRNGDSVDFPPGGTYTTIAMNNGQFDGCRAILFDYGGTLDADGERWPDRFLRLYGEVGLDYPPSEIKRAFYYGEDLCYMDERVTSFGLRTFMEHHVRLQFKALGLNDQGKATELVERFCTASDSHLARAARLLSRMKPRYRLGVVSNFYGNLDAVLREARLMGFFDVIVDSTRLGVQKPDYEIFRHALAQLGLSPNHVLFVGDSYERDIVPTMELGFKTVWLRGSHSTMPAEARTDSSISSLSELEVLLR